MLQLEGAGTDPLIRFTALLSMVCALMSLLYGCMFIIRFGTMRKTYKAAEWANVRHIVLYVLDDLLTVVL